MIDMAEVTVENCPHQKIFKQKFGGADDNHNVNNRGIGGKATMQSLSV